MKKQNQTLSFRLNAKEKRKIQQLADEQGISKAKLLENIVKQHITVDSTSFIKTDTEKPVSLRDLVLENTPKKEVKTGVNKFKLNIQLIPYKNWGKNFRNQYPKSWEKRREEQLRVSNYQCSICGDTKSELHCHEDWDIDHENLIQRLRGLKIVCEYCHHCIHWGRMMKIDTTGSLTERATKHFLKVNNCTKQVLINQYRREFDIFYKNINNDYVLDLGKSVFKIEEYGQAL
ncbi:MAG: hypothetical protein WAQ28_01040 [Bacteroidia bacterium]